MQRIAMRDALPHTLRLMTLRESLDQAASGVGKGVTHAMQDTIRLVYAAILSRLFATKT